MKNKQITLIAIFSSISALLMFFDFSIPIFASFYKFDVSDVVTVLGSLILGFVGAIFIPLIRTLIFILIRGGSNSVFVGEITSFLISSVYCLATYYVYHKSNKQKLVKALIVGSLVQVLFACLINYFIIIPIYINVMGLSMDQIIQTVKYIFTFNIANQTIYLINNKLTFVVFSTLPFNLLKVGIISLIVKNLSKYVRNVFKSI